MTEDGTMDEPGVYPEPFACRIAAGWKTLTGARLDGTVESLFPAIRKALTAVLDLETTDGPDDARGNPRIVVRSLTADDMRTCEERFPGAQDRLMDCPEAFRLEVGEEAILMARSPEGFAAALQSLRQLSKRSADGILAVRRCAVIDAPHGGIRGVLLDRIHPAESAFLGRFVDVLASLRYNALFLGNGDPFLREPGGRALGDRCGLLGIRLLPESAIPAAAIRGLDGPSFLDWEHRCREESFAGAVVEYRGGMSAEEMGKSGFLYNLAYSASPLWSPDYDNFSWERVARKAMEQARRILRRLDPAGFPRIPEEADVYPVPIEYRTDSSDGRGSTPPEELPATRVRIGETADAIVFLHAVRAGFSLEAGPVDGGMVGEYVVHYRDGRRLSIPLMEDRNIGRENVGCGRRYDPLSRAFVTDRRLRSLGCFTSPRLTMGRGGRPAFLFEYEWINPRPGEPIEEIVLSQRGGGALPAVRVDEVRAAHWGGAE